MFRRQLLQKIRHWSRPSNWISCGTFWLNQTRKKSWWSGFAERPISRIRPWTRRFVSDLSASMTRHCVKRFWSNLLATMSSPMKKQLIGSSMCSDWWRLLGRIIRFFNRWDFIWISAVYYSLILMLHHMDFNIRKNSDFKQSVSKLEQFLSN